MTRAWVASATAGGLVLCAASRSAAQETYDSPVAGPTVFYGARTGGGASDALVVGGGGFAGWRTTQWRVGLVGRALWWRADPGVAVDAGAFVSWDAFSMWADSALSIAAFARMEPVVRWVSSTSRWMLLPGPAVGFRVVGIEMSLSITPDIGLGSYADSRSRVGFGMDSRLSFDLVEIVRLGHRIRAASAPLPP